VLGLDEERLPSAQLQSPTLSPARIGDPNPRAALLGALALVLRGARDGVVICFNDRNELNGEEAKRSVVLEELVERIGGVKSALIQRGARHGFAIPKDRSVIGETFDPRYEGLGSAIVNASAVGDVNSSRDDASETTRTLPTEVTIKQLHGFLRSSVAHFVERGLLGSAMPRVELDDHQPRVGFDGLLTFSLRREVIDHFAGIRRTLHASNAEEGYFEILERESVAAEIPLLLKELRKDKYLQKSADEYRQDLACFEGLTPEEEEIYYRPRTLKCGLVLRPRSALPDERNRWTVYHDYSSRQADHPGAPATIRLYPNGMDVPRDWRDTLSMLVDLLVMKVQQPAGDDRFPSATEFFAKAGARSSNGQITYRFTGSAEQAEQLLDRLVALFLRGLDEPIAIGRYTTPMLIEGADTTEGLKKDREEPLFPALFGTSIHEFRAKASAREAHSLFIDIASLVEKSRETGSTRKSGIRFDGGARSTFLPMANFVTHSKVAEAPANLELEQQNAEAPAAKRRKSDDTSEARND
jgi:hypothetical protein